MKNMMSIIREIRDKANNQAALCSLCKEWRKEESFSCNKCVDNFLHGKPGTHFTPRIKMSKYLMDYEPHAVMRKFQLCVKRELALNTIYRKAPAHKVKLVFNGYAQLLEVSFHNLRTGMRVSYKGDELKYLLDK